ncbi:neprilysin-2 [Eurytemora carolleeae]|uniref:neprilysin-2 n=1 Tax=Eurytemora carolleeae TaxID=1294199 RepID=UPI000C759FFB|nr:neprilysin-2 [Eurytemora carolleeae]|eukprot:XP_023345566.1 neprilysin-2-like [Eurytemora affinis]
MPFKAESQTTLASKSGAVEKAMQMEIKKVPWWNKRTRMERRFFLITGVLGVLCVGLSIAIILLARGKKNTGPEHRFQFGADDIRPAYQTSSELLADEPKVTSHPVNSNMCTSKGCISTAAEVMQMMDEKIDPFFYSFACGRYIEETVIPDDRTRTSMFSVLGDKLEEQVRGLLEGEFKPDEPKPFQMAKSVFQSCMNTDLIEELGIEPLHKLLKQLGGWPTLEEDTWTGEGFKWYELIYKFRNLGYSVDYLVDFSVTTDLKNSSYRVLDLDQPGLGMAREYLMKGVEDSDVKAYYDYMLDVANLMGADPELAAKEMKEVLNFEIQLANISLPREERRDASKLYNRMMIKDLSSLDPNTPWLEYINNLLNGTVTVDENEVIIVDVPEYIKKFSVLIEETPVRIQANYMMWRSAASSMGFLTEAADKIALKFSKKLTGKSEEPPRWRKCVSAASGSLSNAVGSLYVNKYFKEDAKASAVEMVKLIREEFMQMLSEVDWMDDSTKDRAKEKARAMVEHIGYPSELLDMSKLTDLYAGLELSPDAYLQNALNMTIFGTNYAFSKLREKVNKTDWVRHGQPAVVNAFYSPLENSIQFPAGILQGIFFSAERPRYMNYGAIGWVIGHEITHGFDDQGRQFDLDGNLVDWWHPETKSSYLKKAECIIEQYGNYTIPDLDNLAVNGLNTQGENIADNGGIKEAYRAYNAWVAKNGPEHQLPGLDFTPNQMFWVSAANVWCAKYRPQAMKLRVMTGVHSPDQFRVQGPFSNMAEFAADWRCPEGSRMNPVKSSKCKVW